MEPNQETPTTKAVGTPAHKSKTPSAPLEENIAVPMPHALLSMPKPRISQWQEKWLKAYQRMHELGVSAERHHRSTREANEMLRVEPADYAGAVALEEWQVLRRGERNGYLHVVTIDGKKYQFQIPA